MRIVRSLSWGVALASLTLLGACAVAPVAPSTPQDSLVPTSSARQTGTVKPSEVASSASATAPAGTASGVACPPAAGGFMRYAPGVGKTVALTFDDGPGPDDAALLHILVQHQVRATFFLTGGHAAAQPARVRALAQAGELVANHSYDHLYPRDLTGGWSVPYLRDQIARTNAALTSQTQAPVCFFRPPGGFEDNVVTAAVEEGMTPVLWSVDSRDWKQPDHVTAAATQAIVAAATDVGTQCHPIVLLHSAKASHESSARVSAFRGNTLAALPTIIDWYTAHGYHFVDLSGSSTQP